jgi:uncharacterized protein YndB with AHSA1/START domain
VAEPPSVGAGVGIEYIRVFDAPRELVWREWTEPERFADWFGGAEADVPVSSVSMDVRPGGVWRATMYAGVERREIHWKGTYFEVEEPGRLVLTITDRPEDEPYELVTVVLTELDGGRTEMLFQQRGGMAPDEYRRAEQGWATFFDRMAGHLES